MELSKREREKSAARKTHSSGQTPVRINELDPSLSHADHHHLVIALMTERRAQIALFSPSDKSQNYCCYDKKVKVKKSSPFLTQAIHPHNTPFPR